MYFGPVYNLTHEQRTDCKVKQKEYAKKVTKLIKNREYTVGNECERFTFRIVSVLPHTSNYDVNHYRLNVEITKVEYSYRGNNEWVNRTPYKGDRVSRYHMNKYKNLIQGELGVFLNIFGLSHGYSNNSASVSLETPKIINRR
jgi:hypothetical protein